MEQLQSRLLRSAFRQHAMPAPAFIDGRTALLLLAGIASLFLPTYWDLAEGINASYFQGHELMVLAVSGWLLWRKREAILNCQHEAAPGAGAILLVLALLAYAFGRSQSLLRIEMLALVFVLLAALLCIGGASAVRRGWFALFFLLFTIPLPFGLVLALTGPMKAAVSAVAAGILQVADYPVGRSGVLITIGQYQLLVAEACAGLHTMFTLEAMGLLYLNLMNYSSWARNLAMGMLVVPVSFVANVLRVMLIGLVTYHFGDAAGPGFIHGAAGLVLFAAALALILAADALLGRLLPSRWRS